MTASVSPAMAGAKGAAQDRQYLSFVLSSEEYAVDILRVHEIRGYSAVTPIPNAPAQVRGMMNLRGTVIPVIDLRARFGMEGAENTKFSVIIVVSVGARVLGMVVDAVSDVFDLTAQAFEPPPELGGAVDTSFMTGIAKLGERLIVLLDIDRAVGVEDLSTLGEPSAASA